jgi:hypothetical protein
MKTSSIVEGTCAGKCSAGTTAEVRKQKAGKTDAALFCL